ncbi:flagellar protein FlgN [Bacillus sp. DJP31]|uniref:flagellar protein FlgN n=1 Tax=Bacillus sp. DJP31 TaxID=3409789 RepID=UPI003BB6819B
MSAEKLIDCLRKMVSLHKSLFELENRKTEVIKRGDIGALSSIIKDENKHVMAINKLEDERKITVVKLLSGYPIQGDEPSLTDVVNVIPSTESSKLLFIKDQLTLLLEELKQVNRLNQELIYSSLQFVNSSLDLFMPQPQTINYNKPTNKGQTEPVKRSVFDSKA